MHFSVLSEVSETEYNTIFAYLQILEEMLKEEIELALFTFQ